MPNPIYILEVPQTQVSNQPWSQDAAVGLELVLGWLVVQATQYVLNTFKKSISFPQVNWYIYIIKYIHIYMYIYLSFKTSTKIWLLWLILTVRQAQAVHLSFSTFAHWQHLSMVDPKKIGQIWKSDLLCYLFSRVPLSNCIVQCVHVSYCFHSLPNPKKKLWWTWPKEARIRQNTIRGFSGTGALKEAFLAPWPLTLSLSLIFFHRD